MIATLPDLRRRYPHFDFYEAKKVDPEKKWGFMRCQAVTHSADTVTWTAQHRICDGGTAVVQFRILHEVASTWHRLGQLLESRSKRRMP